MAIVEMAEIHECQNLAAWISLGTDHRVNTQETIDEAWSRILEILGGHRIAIGTVFDQNLPHDGRGNLRAKTKSGLALEDLIKAADYLATVVCLLQRFQQVIADILEVLRNCHL